METQNVTLALPKELLKRARILAVNKGTSLSGLLVQALNEMVDHQSGYEMAHKHQSQVFREGLDLGTHGAISISRDELHERR